MNIREFVDHYMEACFTHPGSRLTEYAALRLQSTLDCVTFLARIHTEMGIDVLALSDVQDQPLSPKQMAQNFGSVRSGRSRTFELAGHLPGVAAPLTRLSREFGVLSQRAYYGRAVVTAA